MPAGLDKRSLQAHGDGSYTWRNERRREFRCFIVPLDGSEVGERALQPALDLARPKSKVVLLRAIPGSTNALEAFEVAQKELVAACGFLRRQGHTVDSFVSLDQPEDAIVAAAHDLKADVIVMATHARSLDWWVSGSVTDRVLRQSGKAVLIIPSGREELFHQPGKEILVTLDGSPLAELILQPACRLAHQLQGGLVLVQAVAERHLEREAVAREYLENVAKDLAYQRLSVQTVVQVGQPIEAINTVARVRNTAAIALATHGRRGLARLMLGSVATGLAQRAEWPLLVFSPRATA